MHEDDQLIDVREVLRQYTSAQDDAERMRDFLYDLRQARARLERVQESTLGDRMEGNYVSF